MATARAVVLVAQLLHGLGRRSDEIKFATATDLVEVRVLGQKAITRMNRLGTADFGRADNLLDPQITVTDCGGPMQMAWSA